MIIGLAIGLAVVIYLATNVIDRTLETIRADLERDAAEQRDLLRKISDRIDALEYAASRQTDLLSSIEWNTRSPRNRPNSD